MADNLQHPGASQKTSSLLQELRQLILHARQRVAATVNDVQVETCWQIGRHIVEFERGGADRAEYARGLLQTLAGLLTADFGKGFDASNLRNMRRGFSKPIWSVRSWIACKHSCWNLAVGLLLSRGSTA